MKILITLFAAFLYFNLVPPVQMYYVFADNPGTGYVSLNSDGENQAVSSNARQRKYASHKTTNEYTTNPKITKSPPTTVNENKHYQAPTNSKTTESPKRQQRREGLNGSRGKTLPNQSYRSINARNVDYKFQEKQLDQNVKMNKLNYDNKANNLQVNVHKVQIPAKPQKVKLNSNRQVTALSVQLRDENYKRMSTSALVDKSLQQSPNFNKPKAQIVSRILDDMTRRVTDRRTKTSEYRKRETNSNPNVNSDNTKKYIGKDTIKMNEQQPKDASRTDNHEEEVEEYNPPYALFYRMSPESLVSQEGFYLMKSMEEQAENVFSTKEKRLSVSFKNEVDLKKAKTKKNFNTVKLKKKVTSFSNFRNTKI